VLLEIPPLRERGADILALAQHFLHRYAAAHGLPPKQVSRDAEVWLRSYGWPGNVRELSHLMERVTLLARRSSSKGYWSSCVCPDRSVLSARRLLRSGVRMPPWTSRHGFARPLTRPGAMWCRRRAF
jgi:transcriptional regulator with AAA-type ATPase domain